MLTLNTLSDTSAAQRAPAPDKAKTRPADEKRPHADFESYMAALNQPIQVEPAARPQASPADAGSAPKAVEDNQGKPRQQTDIIYDSTPQKAGHDKDGNDKEAAQITAKEREIPETKPVAARNIRADKELLETLGLKLKVTGEKKAGLAASATAKAPAVANTPTNTTVNKLNKGGSGNVTTTLDLLTKSPDVVLAKADGLKRLGEKLGLAFLGRVGEKVAERNLKQETTIAIKTGDRPEILNTALHARTQKAGDGHSQTQSESQKDSKSTRHQAQRSAPRDAINHESAATQRAPQVDSLLTVSAPGHDLAAARLQPATLNTTELRLSEAAATARTADNMRVAVENPLMRADLVRQFNEIMGRAQVLVTDTQNAQFSVKLFPREIGRMEIDLKMVEGEIRGKIVVESEDVKNEMQNFLQNRDNQQEGKQIDLNRIDIEVRSGNQNAQNPQRTPDAEELLQNLVTHTAASVYNATEISTTRGNALYA